MPFQQCWLSETFFFTYSWVCPPWNDVLTAQLNDTNAVSSLFLCPSPLLYLTPLPPPPPTPHLWEKHPCESVSTYSWVCPPWRWCPHGPFSMIPIQSHPHSSVLPHSFTSHHPPPPPPPISEKCTPVSLSLLTPGCVRPEDDVLMPLLHDADAELGPAVLVPDGAGVAAALVGVAHAPVEADRLVTNLQSDGILKVGKSWRRIYAKIIQQESNYNKLLPQ